MNLINFSEIKKWANKVSRTITEIMRWALERFASSIFCTKYFPKKKVTGFSSHFFFIHLRNSKRRNRRVDHIQRGWVCCRCPLGREHQEGGQVSAVKFKERNA